MRRLLRRLPGALFFLRRSLLDGISGALRSVGGVSRMAKGNLDRCSLECLHKPSLNFVSTAQLRVSVKEGTLCVSLPIRTGASLAFA